MDEVVGVQTDKIATYENSRTKRSLVDGDDSNNDREYATAGFYVREKTAQKDTTLNNAGTDVEDNNKSESPSILENGVGDVNNGGTLKIADPEKSSMDAAEPDPGTPDANACGDSRTSDKEGASDSAEATADADSEKAAVDAELLEKDDPSHSVNLKEVTASGVGKESVCEPGSEVETCDEKSEEVDSKEVEDKSSCDKGELAGVDAIAIKKTDDSEVMEGESGSRKKNSSILKEHLTKSSGSRDDGEAEEDMEMELDPSLLCPDISMDVDEAPVITNDNAANEGNASPLPYEATFSTLVDEVTGAEVIFDLTAEEMALRSQMYGKDNPVQNTKIHCTACNVHLGSALNGQNNRFVHPLLKVLICKNCYHFYTSGEFEKDEDGSELYCRWCGQGGEVLCCSSCEFVFCKRCIKNNFGLKRFKEIRNSDDWNCYRCQPTQLARLRASCAEFIDYYRTELARVSSLAEKMPELMTTDYTGCNVVCNSKTQKKENGKPSQEPRKRKRKDSSDDPDYRPVVEEEPPRKRLNPVVAPTTPIQIAPRPAIMVARPIATAVNATLVNKGQQPGTSGQVFRVGNTTFRTKTPVSGGPGYTVTRPNLQAGPRIAGPGYIKILPHRMTSPRAQIGGTAAVPGAGRPKLTPGVRPTQPIRAGLVQLAPAMKHEWFEKTVRAAARVNSNLSYTLTQLNRQQSQATNVEALAVVHNKLQEVLSTSINSLIQVRKNLRTEFIAGIKNFKFPTKPAAAAVPAPSAQSSDPITIKDDDDVIFVSAPATTVTQTNPPPLILSPNVTLTNVKRGQGIGNSPTLTLVPTTTLTAVSKSPSPAPPPLRGGYLKVKSFSALQNVSSDCITIPDDPPTKILDEKTGMVKDVDAMGKKTDAAVVSEKQTDAAANTSENKAENVTEHEISPRQDGPQNDGPEVPDFSSFSYNINDPPSPIVKRMLAAIVQVQKSRAVEEIIRAKEKLNS
ncbi:uncharacterized protein LOC132705017 [Cylas formicarius]|uniref:uncharacterized protein LOC132705017 n=1 Tax=Cylas formicarius TaxID=197179 RepID=UPI002958991C|nr:uncharacterized protein LOC132705017 [Cylas formicarius]